MISVLYIGQYKEGGKFATIQWEHFMEWCETECNKIVVYSRMTYHTICAKFPLYCNIIELERPDHTLKVYAYEINVIDIAFWDYIKEYNYDIDIVDNISHLFFFNNNRNIASLEIVDFENYVLIEEPVGQRGIFLSKKRLVSENVQFCDMGKSDIEDLMQGESWKPLNFAFQ